MLRGDSRQPSSCWINPFPAITRLMCPDRCTLRCALLSSCLCIMSWDFFWNLLIVCLNSVLVTVVTCDWVKPKHIRQSFQAPLVNDFKTLMSWNFDVFSISALYMSMFFFTKVNWSTGKMCSNVTNHSHVWETTVDFLTFSTELWFNIFITFSMSCLYSIGNVSLVSRLILDAGLTAELVKVWSEQTVWVPECHSFILTVRQIEYEKWENILPTV